MRETLFRGSFSSHAIRDRFRLSFGKIEGSIPAAEQVPTDDYSHGIRLCARLFRFERAPAGCAGHIVAHTPGPRTKPFKMEAPEIADGTVEIVALRERRVIDPRLLCAQRSTM